jgi:hypothetical protein
LRLVEGRVDLDRLHPAGGMFELAGMRQARRIEDAAPFRKRPAPMPTLIAPCAIPLCAARRSRAQHASGRSLTGSAERENEPQYRDRQSHGRKDQRRRALPAARSKALSAAE